MELQTGLFILLFTYAFVIAKHLMGIQSHIIIQDFDKNKMLLGLTRELGFFMFLALITFLPTYVDIQIAGIDIDEVVQVVLIYPLITSVKSAYDKAKELRQISLDADETKEG